MTIRNEEKKEIEIEKRIVKFLVRHEEIDCSEIMKEVGINNENIIRSYIDKLTVNIGTKENPIISEIGRWNNGQRNGFGADIDYDNTSYEKIGKYVGDFKNNLKHGIGTLTKKNMTYKGEFKKGDFHGEGALIFLNGEEYSGEFKNGLKHGFGVMKTGDGHNFEGNWKKGLKQGKMLHKLPDGKIIEETYKKGQQIIK